MTKEDLKNASTPIPGLFASGVNADCHKVSTSASGFTYEAGIPSSYSSYSGKKVCRGDVNGLVRAVTQGKWFNQLGGYYTFSQEVSDAIGGYPQGAILYFKDTETGQVRVVRSLIPDNTYNFVETPDYINNEYWSFVDNIPSRTFRPRVFPQLGNMVEGNLAIDEDLFIDKPCLFMIETGTSLTDATDDGSDYTLFITVQREVDEQYYTAGLICYLPSISSVLAQGIISDPRNDTAAKVVAQSFHAYNSPSPIQLYLSAGDVVKLTGNREYAKIKSETYHYWITPLTT